MGFHVAVAVEAAEDEPSLNVTGTTATSARPSVR